MTFRRQVRRCPPPRGPPTQSTSLATYAFFGLAPGPKYLLKLLGAGHLPPYTYQQPELSIVERVTIAFMDSYLKDERRGIARMIAAGDIAGRAQLVVGR